MIFSTNHSCGYCWNLYKYDVMVNKRLEYADAYRYRKEVLKLSVPKKYVPIDMDVYIF